MISEDFTLLPCPAKPRTTVDFEGCAEHRIVGLDKALNQRVKAVFSLIRSRRSAAALGRFVHSEGAWLTYRNAVCESRAAVYEGGSENPVVFAQCAADTNAAHLKELRAFERNLRR